ncbi:MAG TPA: tetratricopeptide repeat protein [Nannocystis sp.]
MNWLRRLLGAPRPRVVTLRDRDAALAFPVQTPLHTRGPTREEGARCGCGGRRDEVLVTTGGPAGDPDLWREHPLALDGFRCRACDQIAVPRFLAPDEVTALLRAGSEAIAAGRDDEAELAFRRVCTSWPAYAPGRYNLGLLYRQRADAEENDRDRPLVRHRLLDIAESHLRDALRGHGMPAAMIAGELAQVLLRREAEGAAREVLTEVAARDDLDADDRATLAELDLYVQKRGDLFQRGADAITPHIHLHDRPRTPLDARARRNLERGVDMLTRHARVNPTSWQALWMAGKGYQALDRRDDAVREFARAFALRPDHPDVGREYALAALQADRLDLALTAATAACAAKPDDPGLVANLALIHLIAGRLPDARTTVERALAMAPDDPITRALAARIDDVHHGRRPQPRTLADLERP